MTAEIQGKIHDSLANAASADQPAARSQALNEASNLLKNDGKDAAADLKAATNKLAQEVKLGTLIIGEFGSGSDFAKNNTMGGSITKDQLQQFEQASNTTVPEKALAQIVINNLDKIPAADANKGLLPTDIETWANNIQTNASTLDFSIPDAVVAAAPTTPEVSPSPTPSPTTNPTPEVSPSPSPSPTTNPTPEVSPSAPSKTPDSSAPQSVEKWGHREFELQPDGSYKYKVVAGDCVWNVAKDVMHHRLSRVPTNAEILKMTNEISEASGLTKNGRNPDLIYEDRDTLIVPPEAKTDPSKQKPTTPKESQENNSDTTKKKVPQEKPPVKPEGSEKTITSPESSKNKDVQNIAKSVAPVLENNAALYKKALSIQMNGMDPTKAQELKTEMANLQVVNSNWAQLHSANPNVPEKGGFNKDQIAQVAKDTKNSLTPDQRTAFQYVADHFTTYVPDGNVLTPKGIDTFVNNAVALDKKVLHKTVSDTNSGLTPQESTALKALDSNADLIAMNSDVITPDDLTKFLKQSLPPTTRK